MTRTAAVKTTERRVSTRGVARRRAPQVRLDEGSAGFRLLIVFTIVTFLNLPNRLAILGAIRPTLLLVGLLAIIVFADWERLRARLDCAESKWLLRILLYIILTLPLVKWPGSVLTKNIDFFIKSTAFFFFVVAFVDNVSRLNTFMYVFVATQLFRVLEPLFLHVTGGYWGENTYLGDGDFANRLAGAPADIIGANGLAFVIVTCLPFLHFWAVEKPSVFRLGLYAALGPLLLYALILSQSRSGVLALAIVVGGIIWLSRRRMLWVVVAAACVAIAIPNLSADQRDRYLSMVSSSAKQSGSAQGRIDGLKLNRDVFFTRPVFGFGLGTSQEADFNVVGETHAAHNLYLEVLIELGLVGFIIYVGYLRSIWKSAHAVFLNAETATDTEARLDEGILVWLPKALVTWLVMCLLFSFSSYGLSEYQFYLFGGLASVSAALTRERANSTNEGAAKSVEPFGSSSRRLQRRRRR